MQFWKRMADDGAQQGQGAIQRLAHKSLEDRLAVVEASGSSVVVTTVSSLPDSGNYFYLPGRSGAPGQTAYFSNTASGTGVLASTSDATKGKVIFGAAGTSAYDELNERWGFGTASPATRVHVAGTGKITDTLTIDQQADRDGTVIHYRAATMATGRVFRAIDDDGLAEEFYIDAGGAMHAPGLTLVDPNSAFEGIVSTAVLTGSRIYTFPNATGTVQLLSGAQTSSATMTWSGAHTFSSATRPLFKVGITIEDPGAGTNTISIIAPTAPTTHIFTWPGSNSAGVLTNDGSGVGSWAATAPATAHNILSATHGDTLAAAVARGSIIVGNATPKWSALAIGAAATVLTSDGTDATWVAPGGGTTHAMLSVTHTDTVANAVSRGSLIYGNATPKWDELVIGTANYFLKSDGTDAAWANLFGALNTWTNTQVIGAGGEVKFDVDAQPGSMRWSGAMASGPLLFHIAATDTFNTISISAPVGIGADYSQRWQALSGYISVQPFIGGIVAAPLNEGVVGQILFSAGAGARAFWDDSALILPDPNPAYLLGAGTTTVLTGTAKIMSRHLKIATTSRLVLAGTATLRIT